MIRIFALIGVLILSGCASIGNPEYGCSGLPEGVRCMATRDIYEASQGGETPKNHSTVEPTNGRDSDNMPKESDEVETVKEKVITDPVVDTFVTPNLPDRPVPVRTPAQVMRIWVASWEDIGSGALIVPGYIYTEIEPRKWVIGRPESAASQRGRLFKPLETSSKHTPSIN